MSPYLFVMAINELSTTLQDAMQEQRLQGIFLGENAPAIHSIMFANDLIICGDAANDDCLTIKHILQSFCQHSVQIPNWNKSSILFSKHVTNQQKTRIRNLFPAKDMDTTEKHLGHPLIMPAKNRSSAYSFIVDKFITKLSLYKANRLWHAGRLTLIKSVFSSIPVYYMANILLSKKLIKRLTSVIRDFLWTGVQEGNRKKPLYLKAWTEICKPMRDGGLGVRDLQAVNEGLLTCTAWRIAADETTFVSKILKGKYYHNNSFWKASGNTPKSAFWTSILKVKDKLAENCTIQIARGNNNIWNSPWAPFWENIHNLLNIQYQNFVYPNIVADLWIPNTLRCWVFPSLMMIMKIL